LSNAGPCFPPFARSGADAIGRHCILLDTTVYSQYKRCCEGTHGTNKTTTLTFRIEPGLKEALRTAAKREYRSIANMVEVLIRDYCARTGITMQEQQALFLDEDGTAKSKTR
jgi:hypothetical protein